MAKGPRLPGMLRPGWAAVVLVLGSALDGGLAEALLTAALAVAALPAGRADGLGACFPRDFLAEARRLDFFVSVMGLVLQHSLNARSKDQ